MSKMLMPNRVWTLKQVMKLLNGSKTRARTGTCRCYGSFGGSGGMFDLSKTGVKEPVLIQVQMVLELN